MKLYCRISGLPVIHSNQFGRLWKEYSTEHPIFRLGNDRLWKLVHSSASTDLQWRKLPVEEQKLIFLALLNHSGLVHWHHPASPSNSLVNSLIPRVYQFCAWKDALRKPTRFPHYSVNSDNANLESIGAWLEECEEIRLAEFQSLTKKEQALKQHDIDEKFSLLQKQAKLSKGAQTRYLNKLVSWALDEAKVPETESAVNSLTKKELTLRELVREIFLIDPDDVHKVHQDDIDYLREYFALNLPQGSISAFAVQERLKDIEDSKQKQLSNFELLDLFLTPAAEPAASKQQEASKAQETPGILAMPADAPIRSNYATAFAYQYAVQQWKIATRSNGK